MNISVLQTLLDLAKSRSTAAANQLAREKAMHLEGLNKLSMLSGFKDDYRIRLQDKMMAGLTVNELNNYQAFIAKLEIAIQQQENSANQLLEGVEIAKKQWQDCEKRLLTFETLMKRARAKAFAVEAKIDQKLTDEFASRRYALSSL
jgi:flagellar protein FliJ